MEVDWWPSQTTVGNCETHGPFDSYKIGKRVTGCPSCSEEAAEKERAAADAKEKVDRWMEGLDIAAIPNRFKDKTVASFIAETKQQQEALAFAVDYVKDFDEVMKTGRSAVFIGRPGTGKTHLSCGIAIEAMRKGYTAIFSTVYKAVRKVKDTWRRGATESEVEAVEFFTTPDLLILDEVGVQFGSETEKQILFDIINERYENMKPVILLSNLNVDGIKTFLGERIVDRIKENGGKAIVFNWDSHRSKNENR